MAMLECGINQTELAARIGVTRQSLSEWLTNCENPKITNIKKIAAATNKPLTYFFEGSGNVAGKRIINTIAASSQTEIMAKDIELLKKEVEIIKLKIEKLGANK